MVKEHPDGMYECESCQLIYSEKGQAKTCEVWCAKHHSCNMEITRYALNKKEVTYEKS